MQVLVILNLEKKMNKEGHGIECLLCQDKIYSDDVHDFKRCKCGRVFIDGGRDYFRCGFKERTDFKVIDRKGKEVINE